MQVYILEVYVEKFYVLNMFFVSVYRFIYYLINIFLILNIQDEN